MKATETCAVEWFQTNNHLSVCFTNRSRQRCCNNRTTRWRRECVGETPAPCRTPRHCHRHLWRRKSVWTRGCLSGNQEPFTQPIKETSERTDVLYLDLFFSFVYRLWCFRLQRVCLHPVCVYVLSCLLEVEHEVTFLSVLLIGCTRIWTYPKHIQTHSDLGHICVSVHANTSWATMKDRTTQLKGSEKCYECV